jgi:hypothetical protein
MLNRKTEALDTLRKAWELGFKDATWARRDPDLVLLHDDPEFEKMYPMAEVARVDANAKPGKEAN